MPSCAHSIEAEDKMIVDSHCHLNMLDLSAYNDDLAGAVNAAKDKGVEYILSISVEFQKIAEVVNIAQRFPNVFASVGVHPDEHQGEAIDMQIVKQHAEHKKVVAIGETGLDYYRQAAGADMTWQHQRFSEHIALAKSLQKPLIIHTRAAREDTLRILQEEQADAIGGVMHCFTEDWAMAKAALDLGFYISMSGIVTFKNATQVQEVALKTPIDRLLIETDAPFLTPVPFRGKKPNEPQYVYYVAAFLAELKKMSFADMADKTTENFFNLFKKAAPSL